MLILDTNVIAALRRPDRSPRILAFLASQPEDSLFLSVVTLGEIERGIIRQESRNPGFAADLRAWASRIQALFGDRLLPFGAAEARIWGALSARIGHDGADLQIAATALAHDAVVVTGNASDFRPSGCRITDPLA